MGAWRASFALLVVLAPLVLADTSALKGLHSLVATDNTQVASVMRAALQTMQTSGAPSVDPAVQDILQTKVGRLTDRLETKLKQLSKHWAAQKVECEDTLASLNKEISGKQDLVDNARQTLDASQRAIEKINATLPDEQEAIANLKEQIQAVKATLASSKAARRDDSKLHDQRIQETEALINEMDRLLAVQTSEQQTQQTSVQVSSSSSDGQQQSQQVLYDVETQPDEAQQLAESEEENDSTEKKEQKHRSDRKKKNDDDESLLQLQANVGQVPQFEETSEASEESSSQIDINQELNLLLSRVRGSSQSSSQQQQENALFPDVPEPGPRDPATAIRLLEVLKAQFSQYIVDLKRHEADAQSNWNRLHDQYSMSLNNLLDQQRKKKDDVRAQQQAVRQETANIKHADALLNSLPGQLTDLEEQRTKWAAVCTALYQGFKDELARDKEELRTSAALYNYLKQLRRMPSEQLHDRLRRAASKDTAQVASGDADI